MKTFTPKIRMLLSFLILIAGSAIILGCTKIATGLINFIFYTIKVPDEVFTNKVLFLSICVVLFSLVAIIALAFIGATYILRATNIFSEARKELKEAKKDENKN